MSQRMVKITGITDYGDRWIRKMGNPWLIRTFTDQVRFSEDPGPWMLLEREHFQRWVNLNGDRNFHVSWKVRLN